jgi:transcriptional regulator with XRE-family HTH domain
MCAISPASNDAAQLKLSVARPSRQPRAAACLHCFLNFSLGCVRYVTIAGRQSRRGQLPHRYAEPLPRTFYARRWRWPGWVYRIAAMTRKPAAKGQSRPRPGLAAARKREGHSQEELAELLGVSAHTISDWENGKRGISSRYRPGLAAALSISKPELERLIMGEPLVPAHAVLIASGDPATRWVLDMARLPQRGFDPAPPPAGLPFLAPGTDGLERVRRNLKHIASAARIPAGESGIVQHGIVPSATART